MSEKPETIKVPRGGIMKISKILSTSPLVVSRVLSGKYLSPESELAHRIKNAANVLIMKEKETFKIINRRYNKNGK